MRKNFKLRLAALVLTFVMLATSVLPVMVAADEVVTPSTDEIVESLPTLGDYNNYLSDKNGFKPAKNDITLDAQSAIRDEDITLETLKDKTALLWNEGNGRVEWTVEVMEDAYYNIKLSYLTVDTGVDYTFSLLLDGETPFEEAATLTFPRIWKNAVKDFKTDQLGNQLSPEQVEVDEFVNMLAKSTTGVTVEPFAIFLTKGTHTITLANPEQAVAVENLVLAAPEQAPSYKDYIKEHGKVNKVNAETIVIEGEKADTKTSSKLIPKADNSDAGMSPLDVMYTKLNYIGGTSWQEAGQTLKWSITVKKSGYYSLGVRYRQSDVINAESWRWLKIDDQTPFEEAKGIRFPYCASWEFFEFGDGENPYYFWLEEGTHTISLEVTMGEMAEYYYRLSEIVSVLGDKYIEIVKITGSTPDLNLDYELFNQIPNLNKDFKKAYKDLDQLANDIKKLTGKRSSQYIAAMNNMSRVLKTMVKNPYLAHQYVSDYYTNYSSLSSWLNEMKNMPLYVDTIQFAPVGQEFVNKNPGFFESIWFVIKQLFISFIDDYINERKYAETDVEPLTIWVNWGRDQATALDTLIRDSFTESTGVPVNVRITNASLINGLLAGNFPDVSLHLVRTEPVNLGIRGALLDLNAYAKKNNIDLDAFLDERFQEGAETPYSYNGALYALPDTQNFQMMFYRTDIFESLGLEAPTLENPWTWDDFLYNAAIIQRNNMNVYIPYTQITAATTISAGLGALNLFPTLMTQNNLSLYNDKLNATALSSVEANTVFDYWTDLYTDYDFQKEADFYNRFRAGTMPLGIAPYSTYITLYSAAPEIKGRWAIACVPGTEGGNDSVAGAGTGCAIVAKSPHVDNAWKFLDWWTSKDTQVSYSNNVESLIGMLGRQQTANIHALAELAWDKEDLKVIRAQWSKVKEIPEVPGSYYFGRALDQAFWSVINDGTNAKDALSKWSKVADAEIKRKIKEYS